MVKTTIGSGKLDLLSIPFNFIEGEKTAGELFGGTLPFGTLIFSWNEVSQSWESDQYQQGFFGQPNQWNPGTINYSRGKGFFIQFPSNAPQAEYDIVLSGEVPGQGDAVSTKLFEANKLYLVGFQYPVSITISDENFGIIPSYGDVVHVWSPSANSGQGGYISATYQQGFFGQPDKWSQPNLVIEPGRGFFYLSSNTKEWTTTKTDFYAWP
jgi:hypothetical protein